MNARRIILGIIVLMVILFGLLAAAKLRATPKYDRIVVGEPANFFAGGATTGFALTASPPAGAGAQVQIGVTEARGGIVESETRLSIMFETDEGAITIDCAGKGNGPVLVTDKRITRRGPL